MLTPFSKPKKIEPPFHVQLVNGKDYTYSVNQKFTFAERTRYNMIPYDLCFDWLQKQAAKEKVSDNPPSQIVRDVNPLERALVSAMEMQRYLPDDKLVEKYLDRFQHWNNVECKGQRADLIFKPLNGAPKVSEILLEADEIIIDEGFDFFFQVTAGKTPELKDDSGAEPNPSKETIAEVST